MYSCESMVKRENEEFDKCVHQLPQDLLHCSDCSLMPPNPTFDHIQMFSTSSFPSYFRPSLLESFCECMLSSLNIVIARTIRGLRTSELYSGNCLTLFVKRRKFIYVNAYNVCKSFDSGEDRTIHFCFEKRQV